jgi:hypothetical protein
MNQTDEESPCIVDWTDKSIHYGPLVLLSPTERAIWKCISCGRFLVSENYALD